MRTFALLVQRDLAGEWRARRAWPETMHLGVLVAVLFGLQLDLPAEGRQRVAGALFWFATLFAALPTLERGFDAEREDGLLDGLRLASVPPATLFLAKLAANALVLAALSALLVALWVAVLRVPLLDAPGATLAVCLLGDAGVAAVGTLLGALLGGLGGRSGSLATLVLPLVLPVVLAASEATRLGLEGDLGPAWGRWVLLLAAFAVVFVAAGCALFEFTVAD
jgi:heme exporter protein CcmB